MRLYHTVNTEKGDMHFYINLMSADEIQWEKPGGLIYLDQGKSLGKGGIDSRIGERKEKITHQYGSVTVKTSYFIEYRALNINDFLKKSEKYAKGTS